MIDEIVPFEYYFRALIAYTLIVTVCNICLAIKSTRSVTLSQGITTVPMFWTAETYSK